jgi:hypothetical protein
MNNDFGCAIIDTLLNALRDRRVRKFHMCDVYDQVRTLLSYDLGNPYQHFVRFLAAGSVIDYKY